MIKNTLDSIIRNVPDFPKKGINFKDITPLLLNYNASNQIIDELVDKIKNLKIDAIVGIESRGFLYGFLLANRLNIPFIPIRKAGKLPGETIKVKYKLEYGAAELEVHKHDIQKGWNILIHDDLLATGGTACATASLINKLEANIVGFCFLVNLSFLDGKKPLMKYSNNIISLIDY